MSQGTTIIEIAILLLALPSLKGEISENLISESNDFVYEEEFYLADIKIDTNPTIEACQDLIKETKHLEDMSLHLGSVHSHHDNTKQLQIAVSTEIKERCKMLISRLNRLIGKQEIIDKRAIELLGDLINVISGVPGPKQYRKQQEAFQKISELLKGNVQNQKANDEKISKLTKVHKLEKLESMHIRKNIRKMVYENTKEQDILIFRSHATLSLTKIEYFVLKCESIIQEGKNGQISMDLVSIDELKSITEDINKKEQMLAPIFMGKQVERYFGLTLAKVIISNGVITGFIRIPLVNFNDRYTVRPVKNNINDKEINFLVTRKDQKSFRIISNTQVERSLQSGKMLISDLRKVEQHMANISCSKQGCDIPVSNILIQEINMESFSFVATQKINIHIICGEAEDHATLPLQGFMHVPKECSVDSKEFSIAKVNVINGKKINESMKITISKINNDKKPEFESKIEDSIDESEKKLLAEVAVLQEESKEVITEQMKNLKGLDNAIQENIFISQAVGITVACLIAVGIGLISCYVLNKIRYYHN